MSIESVIQLSCIHGEVYMFNKNIQINFRHEGRPFVFETRIFIDQYKVEYKCGKIGFFKLATHKTMDYDLQMMRMKEQFDRFFYDKFKLKSSIEFNITHLHHNPLTEEIFWKWFTNQSIIKMSNLF